MPFDGSPEEMYPEFFPEQEDPSGPADREPHRPEWSYGWYFTVDHEVYGFYRSEARAWEEYHRIRDEIYTDEEDA